MLKKIRKLQAMSFADIESYLNTLSEKESNELDAYLENNRPDNKDLSDDEINKLIEDDPDDPTLDMDEEYLKKHAVRVYPFSPDKLKKIRKDMGLSQSEFSSIFAVNVRLIQDWEQGRKTPSLTTQNYLKVIEKEPKVVLKALRSA
jgi:putative transcriptional regulator